MEPNFLVYVLIGFLAQIVDGALGMAYGVVSTTFLLNFGASPVAASASVHISEVFTTGVSGLSHWKLGNVNKNLFKKLIIPGMIGGILGAYLLVNLPSEKIKPFVASYLLLMGLFIIFKSFREIKEREVKDKIKRLGFIGGFLDAIGGGGWGPIVTSTLVARGNHPRFTVGSVNLAEFFVAFSQSIVFILAIGLIHWKIISGLLIGGVVAAPIAAYVCKKLPRKPFMILVGILIVLLSLRTIYMIFY